MISKENTYDANFFEVLKPSELLLHQHINTPILPMSELLCSLLSGLFA